MMEHVLSCAFPAAAVPRRVGNPTTHPTSNLLLFALPPPSGSLSTDMPRNTGRASHALALIGDAQTQTYKV